MTVRRALRIFELRARSVSQKPDLDSELSAEIAFHLDHLVAENIADGMSPGEAEAAARETLALPIFPELSGDEIRYVVDQVVAFFQ